MQAITKHCSGWIRGVIVFVAAWLLTAPSFGLTKTKELIATRDTYVHENPSKDEDHSTSSLLYAGRLIASGENATWRARSYLRWGVGDIPQAAEINSVSIQFDPTALGGSGQSVSGEVLNAPSYSGKILWTSQPIRENFSRSVKFTVRSTDLNKPFEIKDNGGTMRSVVQDLVNDGKSSFNVAFLADSSTANFRFRSSDHTSGLKPTLVISYAVAEYTGYIGPENSAPAGAQWKLNALFSKGVDTKWLNSGDRVEVAAGKYEMEFSGVQNWTKPTPIAVVLSADSTNPPQTGIYKPYPATIRCTIQPPEILPLGASWRLVPSGDNLGNATDWLSSDSSVQATPGQYNLEFKPVPNWTTPEPQTITPSANASYSFIGSYNAVTAHYFGIIEPQGARDAGARWRLSNVLLGSGTTDWQESGTTVDIAPGNYDMEFSEIANWTKPTPINVTVSGNASNPPKTGTYISIESIVGCTIQPPEIRSLGARWRLIPLDSNLSSTTDWLSSDSSTPVIPGRYSLEFKSVQNWTTPTAQTIIPAANTSLSATGTYTLASSTRTIRGKVYDPDGRTMSKVSVKLTSGTSTPDQSTQTTKNGQFSFSDLAAGAYTLSVKYETYDFPRVKVNTTSADATIDIQAFPLANSIETIEQKTGSLQREALEADPIGLATGDYMYSKVLFAVPGIGLQQFLELCYHSAKPTDVGSDDLAPGWSHNLAWKLTLASDGTVKIKRGDGSELTYARATDGSYAATTRGSFDLLVALPAGQFRLTRPDQISMLFSATGALAAISDRYGDTMTLGYSDGLLTTVTDTMNRVFTYGYENRHLVTVTLPDLRQAKLRYNANNDLEGIKDLAGAETVFHYDSNHRVRSIILPEGNTLLENDFDNKGRVEAQRNGIGSEWKIEYDIPEDDPTTGTDATRVTDPDGVVTLHYHDGADRYVTFVAGDPSQTADYTYDPKSNLESVTAQVTLPDGSEQLATTHFTYDESNVTEATNPLGQKIVTAYTTTNDPQTVSVSSSNPVDAVSEVGFDWQNRNLMGITDALKQTSKLTYDALRPALVKSITNAKNETTQFGYADIGYLESVTLPTNQSVHFRFDEQNGRLKQFIDAAQRATGYEFDDADRLKKLTNNLKQTVEYTWDTNGWLRKVTFPGGRYFTYEYYDDHSLKSVTNALGDTISYTYTLAGRPLSVTYPDKRVREFVYEGLATGEKKTGRVKEVRDNGRVAIQFLERYSTGAVKRQADANGIETEFFYDQAENITSINIDGTRQFTNTYDGFERLAETSDERGIRTRYSYRLDGLIDGVQPGIPADAGAQPDLTLYPKTHITFDKANRIEGLDNLAGKRALTWAYDDAGRVTGVTDAAGKTTTSTYTATSGEFEHTTDRKGQNFAVDARDDLGRVTQETNPDGTTTYQYTYAGLTQSMTLTASVGSGMESGTLRYEYDLANRVTSREWNGVKVAYAYVYPADSGFEVTVTYPDRKKSVTRHSDIFGDLATVTDGDRITTTSFDKTHRLSAIHHHNDVTETVVERDALGRPKAIEHRLPAELDLAQQLTRVDLTWTQGLITGASNSGGLAWQPSAPNTTTFTNNPVTARLETAAGAAVAHDANGNLTAFTTTQGTFNLTWNAHNLLIGVQGPGVAALFFYDPEGLRVRSVINGVETRYVWDTQTQYGDVIVERNSANQDQRYYVSSGDRLLYEQNALTGETISYHTDYLGSITLLTNDAGQRVGEWAYSPFGEEKQGWGVGSPYGYLGALGVRDDGIGLLHMRARYYSQTLCRFVSEDPVAANALNPFSLNPYAYGNNSPLTNVDPNGRFVQIAIGAALGFGIDLGVQYFIEGKNWDEIDWVSVGISTGAGALSGGASSLAGAMGLTAGNLVAAQLIGSATVGAVESGLRSHLSGKDFAITDYAVSFSKNLLMGIGSDKIIGLGGKFVGRAAGDISGASTNLRQGRLPNQKLGQLEKYGAGGVRELQNGRIRYYGEVIPATNPGAMMGRRLVREWDPASGATRTWHETLDQTGRVRIVRPQTDGPKAHYMFDEAGNFKESW